MKMAKVAVAMTAVAMAMASVAITTDGMAIVASEANHGVLFYHGLFFILIGRMSIHLLRHDQWPTKVSLTVKMNICSLKERGKDRSIYVVNLHSNFNVKYYQYV